MDERRHDGSHGDECGPCRWQSVGITPSATPSRRNTVAPREADPAWERGIAGEHRRDGTFMPYIEDRTMNPIRLKKWSENERSYTEALRVVRHGNQAAPTGAAAS